jgi:hypothetical protein
MAFEICHHIAIGSEVEEFLVSAALEFQSRTIGDHLCILSGQLGPGCAKVVELCSKSPFAARALRDTISTMAAAWLSWGNCPR